METTNAALQEVPEFSGKAAKALTDYYEHTKVIEKGAPEKLAALRSNLGHFEFSAYGGEETEAMKLRAAERVYLFKQGIAIE